MWRSDAEFAQEVHEIDENSEEPRYGPENRDVHRLVADGRDGCVVLAELEHVEVLGVAFRHMSMCFHAGMSAIQPTNFAHGVKAKELAQLGYVEGNFLVGRDPRQEHVDHGVHSWLVDAQSYRFSVSIGVDPQNRGLRIVPLTFRTQSSLPGPLPAPMGLRVPRGHNRALRRVGRGVVILHRAVALRTRPVDCIDGGCALDRQLTRA